MSQALYEDRRYLLIIVHKASVPSVVVDGKRSDTADNRSPVHSLFHFIRALLTAVLPFSRHYALEDDLPSPAKKIVAALSSDTFLYRTVCLLCAHRFSTGKYYLVMCLYGRINYFHKMCDATHKFSVTYKAPLGPTHFH
jgi:hypothetical protein